MRQRERERGKGRKKKRMRVAERGNTCLRLASRQKTAINPLS